MDFTYLIFGLQVCSNVSLPGLEPALSQHDGADVRLHLGVSPETSDGLSATSAEPFFTSSIRTESGELMERVWKVAGGAMLRIDYADGTQFWLEAKGREVWSCWGKNSSLEDAASYMMGPILGYVLRLRGTTCLHASAVRSGARATAFVGPGGAGKSTIAAALALRGHVVISDDVVALEERAGSFLAVPACPYLALWPESVRALYVPGKDFAAFSSNFPKRLVPSNGSDLRFADEKVALNSLFLLDEPSRDPSSPFLEPVDCREALMWLVANTYANLLLEEEMRAREFVFLGRLVHAVDVWKLRTHEDASRIGALCELIEGALAARQTPSTPRASGL